MSLRTRPSCWQTGWAFLLSLVSLIEKGDECNDKSSKGDEQAQYPYDNHNGLICCHQHHLLPYVLLVNQGRSGGMPLLSWVLSVTSFYHGNLCGSIKKFHFKFQISNRFTAKSLSLSGYRMDNFYPTSTNFNLSYKNRSTTPAITMTVVILLKSPSFS